MFALLSVRRRPRYRSGTLTASDCAHSLADFTGANCSDLPLRHPASGCVVGWFVNCAGAGVGDLMIMTFEMLHCYLWLFFVLYVIYFAFRPRLCGGQATGYLVFWIVAL